MIKDFKQWLSHPFMQDMSAFEWVIFLGFVFCVAAFWRLILAHLFEEL